MDFAKDYLSKFGWQEGRGIGKNADGIVKPIRANLKFDQAGLSFDKAKDLTNPWWEKVFDNAAENLNVSDTTLALNDSKKVVSTNNFPAINLKTYEGYFQKENPKIEHDRDQEKDSNFMNSIRPLNDEDLLKACGGRTAHKGARHGLTLSGKLSRIVDQEKQLLNENVINTENAHNIFQTWIQVKKKKHKRKSSRRNTEECTNVSNAVDEPNEKDLDHLPDIINQEDYKLKGISKKKKKQQRIRDEDLARSLSQLSTTNDCVVGSDSFKFHGVQSNSKVIKKDTHRKKSHRNRKNRNAANDNEEKLPKEKSTKQIGNSTINGHLSSSEDSGRDVQADPMVLQIKKLMSRYPSKKFKVEAGELTPFQKKQLQKSGLRIEFKAKKREKKRNKERKQLGKIIEKMKHSMDFGN